MVFENAQTYTYITLAGCKSAAVRDCCVATAREHLLLSLLIDLPPVDSAAAL